MSKLFIFNFCLFVFPCLDNNERAEPVYLLKFVTKHENFAILYFLGQAEQLYQKQWYQ